VDEHEEERYASPPLLERMISKSGFHGRSGAELVAMKLA
jgi:hypothetical protein